MAEQADMNIKYEKIKLSLIMAITYLLITLPICNSFPLHTSSDELGGIVGAAYFADLDWSGVIENSGYYGFGWYALFWWLFKITDNPILIYRVIIMTTAFLRIMCIPISFYIGKQYLQIKSANMLYLSSTLMPFIYSTSVGMIINEYILEFLFWVILLWVCKIIDKNRKSELTVFYVVALILTSLYSLTIHTRALTVLIAVLVTFFIYAIIKKEKLIFGVTAAGIIIGYILIKMLVSLYQSNVYGDAVKNLANTSVQFATNFRLSDMKVWQVWFHMLLGMIGTQTIMSGGILIIFLIVELYYLYSVMKNKEESNLFYNIIAAISMLCIGATIFAFLFSGFFQGILAVWGDPSQYRIYAYKGLTYVRYWNIYLPPVFLCSLALIEKYDCKKIIMQSAGILILLYYGYINVIVPIILHNSDAASVFFGLAGAKWGDNIDQNFYYKLILLSLIFWGAECLLLHSAHKKWAIGLLVIFMAAQQISASSICDNNVKERMSSKILASYQKKMQLEQNNVLIGNIYVYDNSLVDNNWKLFSIAQFYFNQYTVKMQIPNSLQENDIIICLKQSDEIEKLYKNINCYVLDDNETWYTYLKLDEDYD